MKTTKRVLTCAAVLFLGLLSASAERLPVVGISEQHQMADENGVEDRYARALEGAGFASVVIPCMTNAVALDACVARLDLLVLSGGADIDPARYGAKRSKACAEPDRVRDAFEFALVAAARRRRLPIVGICRGCQLLNVAFGGTLWQDLPSEYTNAVKDIRHGFGSYLHPEKHPAAHTVRIVPGSRLAAVVGAKALAVNSHHHQAVCELAPGFRVAAYSPDGVIEAIEGLDYPAWGVQFHPEAVAGCGVKCPAYDQERFRALISALPFLCNMRK